MAEKRTEKSEQKRVSRLLGKVGGKEARKIKALQEKDRDVWFGLGMFGLVGWSVAIPTLIGIAVGVWLDKAMVDNYSWTLMCLIIGVALGRLNAWFWLQREGRHD
jgi:ATP synthase protein I